MAEKPDPYDLVFGIRSGTRPMTLYRLLGIVLFESDAVVIAAAAEKRQVQLRQAESGPHAEYTPKLMKQVAAARLYLTDEVRKKEYDQKLRARLAKDIATPPATPPAKQPAGKSSSPRRAPARAQRRSSPPTQRKLPELPERKPRRPQKKSRRSGSRSRARAKRKTGPWRNWAIGAAAFGTVCLLAVFFAQGVLFPTAEPQRLQANSSDVAGTESSRDMPPDMSQDQPSSTAVSDSVAAGESPNSDRTLSDTGMTAPKNGVGSAEPVDLADASQPNSNERPPGRAEPLLTMVETGDRPADQPAFKESFLQKTGPFLDQHCLRCHGPDREEGGLRIDQLTADLDDLDSVDHYQNILDEITVDSMPPEEEPQPGDTAVGEVCEALSEHVAAAKRRHESGGGKPVRRLTKMEYANTVFDLTGVHIHAGSLRNDGSPGAFDTQADTLYTTGKYFEVYLDVARDAVRRFIASRNAKPGRRGLKVESPPKKSAKKQESGRFKLSATSVPPAGHLIAGFACWRETPQSGKPIFTQKLGGGTREVLGAKGRPHIIESTFYKPATEFWSRSAGMVLGQIRRTQVVSPQPFLFFEKHRNKLKGRSTVPDSAARPIIAEFAELMGRGRKLDPKLIADLNRLFLSGRKLGEPFWEAIVEPMALSMCTLEAMMHLEDRELQINSGSVSPIDLACRMSYFLWRSAPDSELIRLAESGKLNDPAMIGQQVERMMNDERFDRFLRDFSTQWLELDRQDLIAVDDRLFGKFDVATKRSMKEETIQFMSHVIGEDLTLANLIDSEFAFLNNAMASHYGLPRIEGDEYRRVELAPKDRRGGILTQAGILMQTGTGERSSIVERGVFIAKKMMNAEPPPPPPLVDDLPTSGQDFARMTGAQLVRKHAHLRQCASCHNKIDPMGLGLEEFDAIGLHRTQDVRMIPNYDKLTKVQKRRLKKPTFAVPLETRGALVTGERFKGVEGLKKALMRNKQRLAQSYVEGLLTFANGRKFSVADKAIVEDIVKRAALENYPARSIVKAVVESSAFTSN